MSRAPPPNAPPPSLGEDAPRGGQGSSQSSLGCTVRRAASSSRSQSLGPRPHFTGEGRQTPRRPSLSPTGEAPAG